MSLVLLFSLRGAIYSHIMSQSCISIELVEYIYFQIFDYTTITVKGASSDFNLSLGSIFQFSNINEHLNNL